MKEISGCFDVYLQIYFFEKFGFWHFFVDYVVAELFRLRLTDFVNILFWFLRK